MRHFIIHDANGKILRGGAVEDNTPSDIKDPETEFEVELECPVDLTSYKIVDGTLVEKTDAEKLEDEQPWLLPRLRSNRDLLLAQSDWTQSPDSPLSDTKKQEWATYRQSLRDLPANTTDPSNPTWPTQPS